MSAILIIAGSRSWSDSVRIAAELTAYTPETYELMHGACPPRIISGVRCSADALADDVARAAGYVIHARPADWTEYRLSGGKRGRNAGPLRNEAMAEEAARGIVERRWSRAQGFALGDLAKPDGRPTGTGSMVALMRGRGWPVRHVPAHDAEARALALHVYTARIDGQPRDLDITRAGADACRRALRLSPDVLAPGEPWAPSWGILNQALAARKLGGPAAEAGWFTYVEAFRNEMLASYRVHRAHWTALLARDRVVLRCRCRDANRCHRRLVAGFLVRLGAVHAGELPDAPPRQGRLPLG